MEAAYLLAMLIVLLCVHQCAAGGFHRHSVSHEAAHDVAALDDMVEESRVDSEASFHGEWLESRNLAYNVGIAGVERVRIPLKLNVIFVGFDGDGRGGIHLDEENFRPWFEHVVHDMDHLVIPVGEEQTTTKKMETRHSPVQYNFRLNVLKLDPLVNTILEDILVWNVREEEPNRLQKNIEDLLSFTVDVHKVTSLLHHLLDYLKLSKHSYTVFVLNPKRPMADPVAKYGYRDGLTKFDIDTLYADQRWLTKLEELLKQSSSSVPHALPPLVHEELDAEGRTNDTPLEKSKKWAQWFLRFYGNATAGLNCGDDSVDQDYSDVRCLAHARTSELSPRSLARLMAHRGSPYEREYVRQLVSRSLQPGCLVDAWVSHERFSFIDVSAGPFSWGPTIGSTGVRSEHSVPRLSDHVMQTLREIRRQEPTVDDAIKDISVRYRRCNTDEEDENEELEQECTELRMAMQRMLSSAGLPADEKNAVDILLIHGESDESMNFDVELDYWLSDMATLVSRSIRHVVVPGVPLFPTPPAERVTFQLFVISSHPGAYDPLGPGYFAWGAFQEEVKRLMMPGQQASFKVKLISLGDDPVVASAYHASLRGAVVPSLDSQGEYSSHSRVYLDSKALRMELRRLRLIHGADVNTQWPHRQKMIPIFLFSTAYRYPVLVDKLYQAKALRDMIVVAQSNLDSFDSRLQCNGRPLEWNLRDPLRALLSAAALCLGGLTPPHVSYQQATGSASQDWLWSVGDSPLSHTSAEGHRFSELQRDAVFRNYVAGVLEQSIAEVNHVSALLKEMKTTPENERAGRHIRAAELKRVYEQVKMSWKVVIQHTSHLRWDKAYRGLRDIQQHTWRYVEASMQALNMLDLFRCDQANASRAGAAKELLEDSGYSHQSPAGAATRARWNKYLLAALLLDALCLAAYFLLGRSKRKIKIN